MRQWYFFGFVFLSIWFICSCKETGSVDASLVSKKNENNLDTVQLLEVDSVQEETAPSFIHFIDKKNGISLDYPAHWKPEPNELVDAKFLSPRQGSADSILENVYYKVVHQPKTTGIANTQRMSLQQLAEWLRADMMAPGPGRSDQELLYFGESTVHNRKAYKLSTNARVKGVMMRYDAWVIQVFDKDILLFYAGEATGFNFFKAEAEGIIESFQVD